MQLHEHCMAACVLAVATMSAITRAEQPRIKVSSDAKGFVLSTTGTPFVVWGLNYDHDERGRLIEDYWDAEWSKVEADFREMKDLGANIVRVHLQFGKFMDAADRDNQRALVRLSRLLKLVESLELSLDLTGLGCYHTKDVPAWYDRLSEKDRWAAQARFWEAIARRCSGSPAIFCYDLMNEPIVAAGGRKTDWLGPAFAGKHFVQYITLDSGSRPREEIACAWIRQLTAAIRMHDKDRLITVGLVPWSLNRPNRLYSGFDPKKIAAELDFVSVHLYPEAGKIDDELATLRGFAVGKPLVIEEMFPLKCSAKEFESFLTRSRYHAAGWIGFYWGQTPDELRGSRDIQSALTLDWLEIFQRHRDAMTR